LLVLRAIKSGVVEGCFTGVFGDFVVQRGGKFVVDLWWIVSLSWQQCGRYSGSEIFPLF
jgi:hypothetical protein